MLDRLRQRVAMGLFKQAARIGMTVSPAGRGAPPRRGTPQILNAYSELPWLRAVTNKIGKSVGATTWRAFTVQQDGRAVRHRTLQRADFETRKAMLSELRKQGSLTPIDEHAVLDLIEKGNAFFDGRRAHQVTQTHLDLVGEAFWLKERDHTGLPAAWWPLPAHWIRETPTPQKPRFLVQVEGKQETFPDSEIEWLYEPDPLNPYRRGSGTAQSLDDELSNDQLASKHIGSFFFNRTVPELFVTGDFSPDEAKRLEEQIRQKHQSFQNAYKAHFMGTTGGTVTVQQLSQTFQNLQLVDLRRHERDTIIQVYGAPPEIMGVTENSNRSTSEAAEFHFARWVLLPRLEFLRGHWQRIAEEFDERIVIDFESPVMEDKELRRQLMNAAPWAFMVDQFQTAAGFDELPNDQGKVFIVPLNMAAVKQPADATGDSSGARALADLLDGAKTADVREAVEAARRQAQQAISDSRTTPPSSSGRLQ